MFSFKNRNEVNRCQIRSFHKYFIIPISYSVKMDGKNVDGNKENNNGVEKTRNENVSWINNKQSSTQNKTNTTKSKRRSFNHYYHHLKRYKAKYGHCNVEYGFEGKESAYSPLFVAIKTQLTHVLFTFLSRWV